MSYWSIADNMNSSVIGMILYLSDICGASQEWSDTWREAIFVLAWAVCFGNTSETAACPHVGIIESNLASLTDQTHRERSINKLLKILASIGSPQLKAWSYLRKWNLNVIKTQVWTKYESAGHSFKKSSMDAGGQSHFPALRGWKMTFHWRLEAGALVFEPCRRSNGDKRVEEAFYPPGLFAQGQRRHFRHHLDRFKVRSRKEGQEESENWHHQGQSSNITHFYEPVVIYLIMILFHYLPTILYHGLQLMKDV